MTRQNFNPGKWSREVDGIEMKELKCGWYIFETKVNNLVEAKAYVNADDTLTQGGYTFENAQIHFKNYINNLRERSRWH